MNIQAVITGDLVQSRQAKDRPALMARLRELLELLRQQYGADYEIFRGDSFQLLLAPAPESIQAAILIRAGLIAAAPGSEEIWDARLALGFGSVKFRAPQVAESDGEAFLLSGNGLDGIAKTSARLILSTPWPELNDRLALLTRFADDIISSWSHYSAETAFYQLLYNEPQTELAKRLGRSQPTIHKRIATAKLELIRAYIEEIKQQIAQRMTA